MTAARIAPMAAPTAPSRLRLLAAFVTSATATLLLVQLLGVGHAEEPPPVAAAPPPPGPVLVARAERPPAASVDTVLPPPPVAQRKPSRLKKLLPVSHFGGY